MIIYVTSLYAQCLRYNICSAWFLNIRISTCLYMHLALSYNNSQHRLYFLRLAQAVYLFAYFLLQSLLPFSNSNIRYRGIDSYVHICIRGLIRNKIIFIIAT